MSHVMRKKYPIRSFWLYQNQPGQIVHYCCNLKRCDIVRLVTKDANFYISVDQLKPFYKKASDKVKHGSFF